MTKLSYKQNNLLLLINSVMLGFIITVVMFFIIVRHVGNIPACGSSSSNLGASCSIPDYEIKEMRGFPFWTTKTKIVSEFETPYYDLNNDDGDLFLDNKNDVGIFFLNWLIFTGLIYAVSIFIQKKRIHGTKVHKF